MLSHMHLQLGFHDATCRLVSFSISGYFSHGVLAWIITTSAIPEPCSSDFPCQDWDSGVHWDAFGDDLVHFFSRPQLIHTTQRGLINWRQVYMVRLGICFFGLVLLYDVCQTPMLIMLGWLWWPMLICNNAWTCVMINQGAWCEDCCTCHAHTNSKP